MTHETSEASKLQADPPDEELSKALHQYAKESLTVPQ